MAVVVDSSVWIDAFGGETFVDIEKAMGDGSLVMSPLVIAELLSGELTPDHRAALGELLQDYRMHQTDLGHWMRVGELRRMLASRGVNATIPDAHIAQCALDLDATLFSRDAIFASMANFVPLRLR